MSGMTLYNTLRAMPFELITHNVGNVDSIGNAVFLAGDLRSLERDQLPATLSERLPKGQTIRVLTAPRDGRPFLIGNRSERGEQLFYRAAGTVNLVFLLLALALGVAILRYGQGG